jgi:diguanylate cyclase (GGDEF)-like protein
VVVLVLYHREHPDAGVFISGPVRGEDNRPMILVSRRVDGADGRFAGVVMARLEVAFFERVYDTINVGGHGTITLASDDAVILVRKPFGLIGSRLADTTLFEPRFRGQPSGTFLRRSELDRSLNVYAFRRLGAYPFVVEASVSEDEFLAEWRATALVNAVAIALTVALIAMLALLLGSQIARRERAEAQLARIALLDALTGLGNRRQFDATLGIEWTRARRSGRPLAMLMIDVDNFKAYNDRYGHPAGDAILSIIGETIAANVRGGELGARYGGEEFAVILPETPAPEAFLVAERIRTAVFDRGIPHAGGDALVVTLSVGVAASVAPLSEDEPGALVRKADRALYRAKAGGRNRSSIESECIAVST